MLKIKNIGGSEHGKNQDEQVSRVKNKAEVFESDDVFYIEGVNNDFEYKLELGATGLPIKITTKPDIAKIEFRNVKII